MPVEYYYFPLFVHSKTEGKKKSFHALGTAACRSSAVWPLTCESWQCPQLASGLMAAVCSRLTLLQDENPIGLIGLFPAVGVPGWMLVLGRVWWKSLIFALRWWPIKIRAIWGTVKPVANLHCRYSLWWLWAKQGYIGLLQVRFYSHSARLRRWAERRLKTFHIPSWSGMTFWLASPFTSCFQTK